MRERGFSLLEVLMALGVLAFVTLSIATGIGTSHGTTRALEEEVLLLSRGQELLERALAIPHGRPTDPTPSGEALTEMFDDDDDFGPMSLHQLKNFGPVEFEPAGFPVAGRWRIIVDADLNGDGDTDDPDEGRDDLLRIVVTHEGRLLARTVRFDPTG